MIKISCLLILAVAVVAVMGDGGEHNWLYPDLTDDQELLHWGGLCENGTAQSPIDLVNKEALRGIFPDLEFVNYETKQSGVSMMNTGYSVKVSGFQKPLQLLKGPLHDTYVVEQIHLHWWSEHTIDNVRYPMEAHIVHRNTRYATVAEALEAKDGLTVLGVLYHLSNERNAGIDSILENLDAVKDAEQINEPVKMKNAFVTKQLFGQFDSYFNYAGSLTTPSCAESVTWIVLGNTFPVTQQQVDRFREMEFQKNGKLVNNYRVIQKTNKRAVVKVLVGNARDGATQTASFSLLGVLIMALMASWLH